MKHFELILAVFMLSVIVLLYALLPEGVAEWYHLLGLLVMAAVLTYGGASIAADKIKNPLERTLKQQNRFVSDAAHELATPLTVITGHADMLLRHGADNPELLTNGLATVRDEALRMSQLVDNLLHLAKSDSGKLDYNFESVDISKIVTEAVHEATALYPTHNITASARESGNMQAVCDIYAVRRVLRILLSNAARYSPENSGIHITLEESPSGVRISVSDTGIGIPAEHLPHIFERFYRADPSRSKKTGSSGLGLSIAKEIIGAHSGEITATSIPRRGTTISFSLPRAA